jgi:O-antigen/teichoic acid export membrane protein
VLETATLAVIAYRYVTGLSVSLVKPKLDELRLLYGFGLPSFFVLFAFKLISYTDSTVIGITLGLASVAVYSFPLQIVGYARMCVGGFSGVLLPRLTLLATLNDLPGLRQAYLNSARIGCFIAGWLGGVVITLGPPFLNRWIGPEYGPPSEMVLVWLTVAAFAQALSTQVAYPFYQALHIVRFPAMVLTLEGLVNLALTIYLAPRLGITGVAIATAIPAVFVSLAILPVTLCRKLGLPLWALIVRSVIPGLLMLLATWASQALVAGYVTADSYTIIIVRGMMTVPVALAVFFTTFPVEERHAIERLLRLRAG